MREGGAHLGVGGQDLFVLTQHPGAVLMPGTTGLHHFAILVPSRLALAQALRHLDETHTVPACSGSTL